LNLEHKTYREIQDGEGCPMSKSPQWIKIFPEIWYTDAACLGGAVGSVAVRAA